MYFLQWLFVFVLISGANATGQLSILHHPNSLKFHFESSILEDDLLDVYLAALGLTSNKTSQFKGMKVINPFDAPEAIVEIYIEGIPDSESLGLEFFRNYKLIISKHLPQTFEILKKRITKHLGSLKPDIVKIDFSSNIQHYENAHVFGDLKPAKPESQNLKYLKPNQEKDLIFLSELEFIKAVVDKISSGKLNANGYMDYFRFHIRKLHDLSEHYGKHSEEVNEAKQLLGIVITDLKNGFIKSYKGSVLITLITTDEVRGKKTKKARPLIDDEGTGTFAVGNKSGVSGGKGRVDVLKYGVATDEDDPDFPQRFNLLFWFGLTYFLALTATVYFVMRMEPDEESIIYRMTNTHISKKEH